MPLCSDRTCFHESQPIPTPRNGRLSVYCWAVKSLIPLKHFIDTFSSIGTLRGSKNECYYCKNPAKYLVIIRALPSTPAKYAVLQEGFFTCYECRSLPPELVTPIMEICKIIQAHDSRKQR